MKCCQKKVKKNIFLKILIIIFFLIKNSAFSEFFFNTEVLGILNVHNILLIKFFNNLILFIYYFTTQLIFV